ncbi:hypothetical protein [Rugosimonospora africana]|uniref:Uncharacterized protein n=1 Tax=Rugosimonospora africana TaxID=556532 RepID=A0A8J3QSZ6_9ACTN|nr:hypothetical protein [Rugosimonospora africana]GIH15083.1 hypothetical protein Raf01_32550 [Rugosimonospora africana]
MAWSAAARLGLLAAAAVGVVMVLSLPTSVASAGPAEDGAIVYCLAHRAELVDAAVALGKGGEGTSPDLIRVGGADLTIEQWRLDHPAAFQTTCAALRAAAGTSGANTRPSNTNLVITAATTLFSAAIGAGFTWLVTAGRDRATRRRQDAADLRGSVQSLAVAVQLYLRGWQDGAPTSVSEWGVIERLNDLEAKLGRIGSARSSWDRPGELLRELRGARFGRAMLNTERWAAIPRDQRRASAGAVEDELDKFARDAEHVAYRHEHWRRRARDTAETR